MEFYNYLLNFKGYTDATCKTYCKYAKELIANNLDYLKVLNNHKNTSNNSKRVIISAIKKYYEFSNDKRYHELKLPKKEKKIQNHLSYDEYRQLLIYYRYKKDKFSKQMFVILRLLFETGIRSAELLSITKNDIYNHRIKINGKNKKQRFVHVCNDLYQMLEEMPTTNNKLFDFSYKNLYKRIARCGKKVLNKNLSPHMFRRGFATYCSKNNIDIFDICYLMGHENINTTRMYIKREVDTSVLQKIFAINFD